MRKYKIYYQIYPQTEESLNLEEARAKYGEDIGACDEVLFGSIVWSEDGSSSYLFLSISLEKDNEDGRMSSIGKFKAWASLAHKLAQELPEGSWQKEICDLAHEKVRANILK